jgi:hypothetical protein
VDVSRGLETYRRHQPIQVINHALIETRDSGTFSTRPLGAVNEGQDVLPDVLVVVETVASRRRSSGSFSTAFLTP